MTTAKWFSAFTKKHPGRKWRQTGGPPLPPTTGEEGQEEASLPSPGQLWKDYQEVLSVHRVGEKYGASGETIRQRLVRAGYQLKGMAWSTEELSILREWYTSHDHNASFDLAGLAARLGRPKSNVSRKARELGLTDGQRKKQTERKPPRSRKYATDEDRRAATSARIKKYFAENGHPRGALGLKHSEETKRKVSEAHKRAWADPTSGHNSEAKRQRASDALFERNKQRQAGGSYSRATGGRRPDLDDRYFRSSWEANYARYLNLLVKQGQIVSWEY